MFGLLIKFLTDPRAWLGVAAVLLCSGLLTGYVAEQRLAERMLAEKARMPEPVLIQALDFDAVPSGERETSFVGEVDFSKGEAVVTAGGERIFVLPVYAVSSGGKRAALVRMYEVLGTGVAPQSHRPIPRSAASEQPRVSAVLAIAITVEDTTPSGLGDLGLRELGQGFHGAVVHVDGVNMSSQKSQEYGGELFGFAGGGLPIIEPVAVRPGVGMERAEPSTVAALQLFLGFLILTAALMLFLWRRMERGVLAPPVTQPNSAMNKKELATPGAFSPIASQDELFSALHGRSENDQLVPTVLATARNRISRLATVRNRR